MTYNILNVINKYLIPVFADLSLLSIISLGSMFLFIQILLIYFSYIGIKNNQAFEKLATRYNGSSISRLIIVFGPIGQAVDGILTKHAKNIERDNTQTDIIKDFWALRPDANIDIVCSEIPEESKPDFAKPAHRNYLRYAKFADLDSLIYIKHHLARISPAANFRSFTHTEYHDLNTDVMILVGGPAWNENAAELQIQLPCHFERNPLGDDDPIVFDIPELDQYIFSPNWDENNNLISDISLFSKMTLEDDQRIFYISGCLTWGVKGAAKCFLDPKVLYNNLKYIQHKVGDKDFLVLFETERYGRKVTSPIFSENPPLVLVTYEEDGFSVERWNIGSYYDE